MALAGLPGPAGEPLGARGGARVRLRLRRGGQKA